MIKPGSVPQPATTHQQHPHHQSHQLPVVLSLATATAGVGEDGREAVPVGVGDPHLAPRGGVVPGAR